MKRKVALWCFVVTLIGGSHAIAQNGMRWVSTWAASPQLRAVPAQAANAPANSFNDQTVRMIVHASIGGERLRVQLSNAFGATSVLVGEAHIALRSKESAIVEGSDRALSFGNKRSITIPAGALVFSDPVDLKVPPLSDLAISIYFPKETGPATSHTLALHTSYISGGNVTAKPAIADAMTSQSWYWVSSLDVWSPSDAAAIVALGDSITDGRASTAESNRSWPARLAQRLSTYQATATVAVLNHGIAGNRLLRDNVGTNALARFDRDVLSQTGVKWVIILEGINDIRLGTVPNSPPADVVTADDVIGAYRQLIERARTHGLSVIGCTLTPYGGSATFSELGEVVRTAVNQWIRTAGAFDAVFDFDGVARDPDMPTKLRPEFDSGDHLHPNDVGYGAMADSVKLSIFAEGLKGNGDNR